MAKFIIGLLALVVLGLMLLSYAAYSKWMYQECISVGHSKLYCSKYSDHF